MPTRGIKYWGLSGMPSASLAASLLSVDRKSTPNSPTFHTANVGHHFKTMKMNTRSIIKKLPINYISNLLIVILVLSLMLNSNAIRVVFVIMFAVIFGLHIYRYIIYKKEINKYNVVFSLSETSKINLKSIISIILYVIILVLILYSVRLLKIKPMSMDYYMIITYFIWLSGKNSAEINVNNYKFANDFILKPSYEMNIISWRDIRKLEINKNRYKFSLMKQNGEVISFKIDKSLGPSINEVYDFIDSKIKNGAQHTV